MSSQRVVLSEAHSNRMNVGKKRSYNPEDHKDFKAKKNREAGNPYVGRKGPRPGILPPDQGKICGACIKLGCLLTFNHKHELFTEFRRHNYNRQTAMLTNCIEVTLPTTNRVDPNTSRKKFTYAYSVNVNGAKYPVCRKTLINIFGISDQRISVLVQKLTSGDICPSDKRGTHQNRKRVSEEVRNAIRLHIRSFPYYESHYGRSSGDPLRKYLDADLTITKMYSLFIQQQRDNDSDECEEWIYTHIFHTEFRHLRIMSLKSDTCDTCDRYKAQIKDATANEKQALEFHHDFHKTLAETATASYRADRARSRIDDTYIVLTVDLQQVLFTPSLQNSSSFYLRKLSNYNLCVTNANDGSSSMMLWNEIQGNRGSNEVASLIYKYVAERYTRTRQAQHLVIWFDRCTGQNNNNIVLTMLMKLVRQGYFQEVHQKFFVTGHSYNDCDRMFGMIEKKKKTTIIYVPSDIEALVSESSVKNPFTPVSIQQQDFLDFKSHANYMKHPPTFRITQHLYFRYSMHSPNSLCSKRSHDSLEPELSHPLRISLQFNQAPVRAYQGPLQINTKKLADLSKLSEFLHGEAFAFYDTLITEQRGMISAGTNQDDETDSLAP